MSNKKPKVIFEPGCFDNLDMSQEELDKFIIELQEMAESGEMFKNSREFTEEDIDNMDPEERERLLSALNRDSNARTKRLN
jgi:hypothetical protein